MKIYDISQEVFSCCVYPGDPSPAHEVLSSIDNGDVCNLSAFYMCAHNGTHIDAPRHFINGGTGVDGIDMTRVVGMAYVAEHNGMLTADGAEAVMCAARTAHADSARRILIKGDATVTLEAAEVFCRHGVYLVGNESQTVGPHDAPMAVHNILLGQQVVLLEGIRLSDVPEGVYLLCAQPLNLGGCDGAPVRAILIDNN